jgi:hypothetical protein
MNEQFWRNAPKVHIDSANIAVMRGMGNTFLLALLSGGNAQVFTFSPEHMKRFAQLLTYHVAEYEKTDGKINVADWTPGVASPFSIDDLQGGKGEGG